MVQALLGRDGSGRWAIERPQGPGGDRGPTVPSSRPRVDKSDPAVPILFEALRQGVNLGEGSWGVRGRPSNPFSHVSSSQSGSICSNNAMLTWVLTNGRWADRMVLWRALQAGRVWRGGWAIVPKTSMQIFRSTGVDLKINFSNNHRHLKFSWRREIRTEAND